MLKYVTISLFDSPAQTLVNTVNTVGVMGKGIAKEFKTRYPQMFEQYREHCRTKALDVGKLWLWRTPNKWVLNFPTKKHWRNPSRAEWIEAGLKKFRQQYAAQGIKSVSFPQVGCGNGGLDWESVVKPLMEKYLKDLAIPVYIHVAAQAEGFVPEHLDRNALQSLREELMGTREDVDFERFFADVQRALGRRPVPLDRRSQEQSDEITPLPPIYVENDEGDMLELPGEDFEDLWHALRQRGAVPVDEFPGSLRNESESVVAALLRLDYLKPISFAKEADRERDHRVVRGVRFAPRAGGRDDDAVLADR